jgi:hypothetical protein
MNSEKIIDFFNLLMFGFLICFADIIYPIEDKILFSFMKIFYLFVFSLFFHDLIEEYKKEIQV